jgi:hypothetical protein
VENGDLGLFFFLFLDGEEGKRGAPEGEGEESVDMAGAGGHACKHTVYGFDGGMEMMTVTKTTIFLKPMMMLLRASWRS